MIALLGIIKSIPAAVLLALAGTNHMIEDNRPMADTIIAPVYVTRDSSGRNRNRIHDLHFNMMARCYTKTSISYRLYGELGITVCDEWHDRKAFFAWAIANGWRQGLQIDRIDGAKGYCPSNCRFVTPSENSRNRRSTKFNPDIVRAIRMLRWSGIPEKDVSIIFDCNRKQVNEIMRFVLWGDV